MLGPHHWVIDELGEGPVLADEQRLTQALMQLASNAAAHTAPEGTIGMGSRILPDSLVLWVRDTGSGMSEAEQEGIFERFRRGTGRRTSPGAGLGLAIVNSIMEAHGGQVRVQSVKGAGSTFELSLPLLRPETPDESGQPE